MSIVHEPPVYDESAQPPLAAWPGGYGPGYPGGPAGPGYWGPGGPRRPVRRPRRRFALTAAAAVVAIAAAIGGYWGTKGAGTTASTASSSGHALTTSQIASKVDPGLVDINTTLGYQQAAAAGTGIVLNSSGEVLTNNHVVEGATSINVTDLGNGHTYKGTVVGYDQSADVAVVQLQDASGLQTAPLGNSSGVTVGQQVLGLGNAGGKGGTPSQAAGNVTALGQSITASDESSSSSEQLTGLIETNAPIQAGDSGGPLASSTGQVVGMDTAASQGFQLQSNGQNQQTQSFAIPVNTALSVANQIEGGNASSTVHIGSTGFLGVELQTSSSAGGNGFPGGGNGYPGGGNGGGTGGGSSANGASVAGVLPGTPAAQLGLNQGDTITSLGGQTVNSPSDVQRILNQYHPGDKVSIGWTDQFGQSQSGSLTLVNGPVG
jgi:S1-C subfamily serine protease